MSMKTKKALSRLLSFIATGYELPAALDQVRYALGLNAQQVENVRQAYIALGH